MSERKTETKADDMARYFEIHEFIHQGGSKDYHFILLMDTDPQQPAYMIKRWGKTGSEGQFKQEEFRNTAALERAFESEKRTRGNKGYRLNYNVTYKHGFGSLEALRGNVKEFSTMRNQNFLNRESELTKLVQWMNSIETIQTAPDPKEDYQPDAIDRGDVWGSW